MDAGRFNFLYGFDKIAVIIFYAVAFPVAADIRHSVSSRPSFFSCLDNRQKVSYAGAFAAYQKAVNIKLAQILSSIILVNRAAIKNP